jgi:hypothetical protein
MSKQEEKWIRRKEAWHNRKKVFMKLFHPAIKNWMLGKTMYIFFKTSDMKNIISNTL